MNSISPYSFSLHKFLSLASLLPSYTSRQSLGCQWPTCPGSCFQCDRSRPVNRLVSPRSTSAQSAGDGLLLGNSLILMFLNQHSAPSDSSARYPLRGLHWLTPLTS